MALENQNSLISHTASAGQTQFSYPYAYFQSTDIIVEQTDSNGLVTRPTFTVSATNNDPAQGATVTLITPASAGDIVVLSRIIPITQEYDLQEGATINPTALNKAFDRVVAQNQQQDSVRLRSIQHPTSDPVDSNGNPSLNYTVGSVDQRAGKVLGYDEDGNVTQLSLLEADGFGVDTLKGMDLTNNLASVKIDTDTLEFQTTGELSVKASKTGAFDNPILRWDGTSIHIENTIQGAIDNASSGDTILLKDGTYTEDIQFNKADISLIGSGSGQWTGTTYKGGTIIKGEFRWRNDALNCKLKSVGLTPNNPSNNTSYNLSFMGSSQSSAINFNCYIDDVAFYGDGFCTHNTEFRGKKWFVTNVRSYNAGTHNFPVKAADSVFRNIYVDNNGVSGSSCFIFKCHLTTGNYGSPNNTVIDGFEAVTSGAASYGGFLIECNNATNESMNNLIVRNGFINNLQTGNIACLRIKGNVQSNNIIKNITIDNVAFKGGQVGIRVENGQSTTSGQGVEGVYIRNCTFIEPVGTESGRYAINNNFGGSPAFGMTVGNITVRDYPDNQVINISNAANAAVQQGSIFVVGLIGDVVFQTAIDINSTATATNGTISAVSNGVRTFTSSSSNLTKKLEFGDYPSATLANGETYRVSYEAYSPDGVGTANISFGGQIVKASQTFGAGSLNWVSNEFTLTAGVKYDNTPFPTGFPNTDGLQFNIYATSSSALENGKQIFIRNLKVEVPAD